jgi:hypothetical protein
MMKSAWIILAAILAAGCSGGGQSTSSPAPAPGSDLKTFEADFRPSDHDPHGAAIAGSADHPGVHGDPAARADSGAAANEEFVQGFRVQIFSSPEIDLAKEKLAEAEGYFPTEWFYIQYDPPAYKIRAGNFIQRYEADRFGKLAIERGFSESWTVPEKVVKNPPLPRRDVAPK